MNLLHLSQHLQTHAHPMKKQTMIDCPSVHLSTAEVSPKSIPPLSLSFKALSWIPMPGLGGCSSRGLQREHGVAILWLLSALWWVECISSGIDSWKGMRSRGGAAVSVSASAVPVLSACGFLHSEPRCVLPAAVLYLHHREVHTVASHL